MRQGMESDPFIASNQNMPSGMEGELIEVKPGLRLAVVNCHPQDDLRIEFETDEVPLEFSFYLAGRASYAISHGQGENKFQSRPGLNTVAAFPHSRGTMEIPAQAEARMVAIHIERHVLLEYFADLPRVDVPELGQAMDNGAFPYCFRHAAMQPSMSVAAHQILTCPYHGLARKIFYESKTLELIALQFGSLMEGVPVPLAQPPPQPARAHVHGKGPGNSSGQPAEPAVAVPIGRQRGPDPHQTQQGIPRALGHHGFRVFAASAPGTGPADARRGRVEHRRDRLCRRFQQPQPFRQGLSEPIRRPARCLPETIQSKPLPLLRLSGSPAPTPSSSVLMFGK